MAIARLVAMTFLFKNYVELQIYQQFNQVEIFILLRLIMIKF